MRVFKNKTLISLIFILATYGILASNGYFTANKNIEGSSTYSSNNADGEADETAKEQSGADILREKLAAYDFTSEYPMKPSDIIKINNEVLLFIYDKDVSEEDIEWALKIQREIFSEPLAELNPLNTYVEKVVSQITKVNNSSSMLTDFVFSETVTDAKDKNYCRINVKQIYENGMSNNVEYTLVNEDGKWKIFSWAYINAD